MNYAINAGMETISCGPETDASKTYMIVSSFHTSFLAAEISISAAEKTVGGVPAGLFLNHQPLNIV